MFENPLSFENNTYLSYLLSSANFNKDKNKIASLKPLSELPSINGGFLLIEYDNYYFLNVKEVENVVSLDCVINTLKKVYNIPERNFNLDFDESRYYESDNFYNFIIETIFKGVKPDRFPIEKKIKEN